MRTLAAVILALLIAAAPTAAPSAATAATHHSHRAAYHNHGRPLTNAPQPQQILHYCYIYPDGHVACA